MIALQELRLGNLVKTLEGVFEVKTVNPSFVSPLRGRTNNKRTEMKSVELQLNKRLLIVEVPQHSDMNNPFEILQNSGFNYLVFFTM